ncbi:hypothetical protein IQ255_30670 [Pleurocapsales cyanobacterium LEGE 10410]|nr:hypothetical protein [Pleurocapsales cyanobacterium LEGE 10410]
MKKLPFYHQYDQMDCGPTLLLGYCGGQASFRMIVKHHGRRYSLDTLLRKSGIKWEGVSLLGMSEDAVEIRFLTVGIKYAGITKTRTIFLNGYELLAAYRVNDLAVLFSGLTNAFANHISLKKKKVHSGNARISEK